MTCRFSRTRTGKAHTSTSSTSLNEYKIGSSPHYRNNVHTTPEHASFVPRAHLARRASLAPPSATTTALPAGCMRQRAAMVLVNTRRVLVLVLVLAAASAGKSQSAEDAGKDGVASSARTMERALVVEGTVQFYIEDHLDTGTAFHFGVLTPRAPRSTGGAGDGAGAGDGEIDGPIAFARDGITAHLESGDTARLTLRINVTHAAPASGDGGTRAARAARGRSRWGGPAVQPARSTGRGGSPSAAGRRPLAAVSAGTLLRGGGRARRAETWTTGDKSAIVFIIILNKTQPVPCVNRAAE